MTRAAISAVAGADLRATFIVRLRREPGTPAGEWRGEVEHVQSARLARFVDRAGLSTFVWSQLADLEHRPPAPGDAREPSVPVSSSAPRRT